MNHLPKYQPTIEIKENKIKISYNRLDYYIRFHLEKILKKKTPALFITINAQYMEFYSFFTLEVYEILKYLLVERSDDKLNKLNLRLLKSIITTIENEYWKPMENTKYKIDYDNIKMYLRYEPLEHQVKAFETYENIRSRYGYRGMLLDAAVGSGKSMMSIALSLGFHSDRVIVIAPLQTIEKVWVKTISGNQTDPEMIFKEKQPVYVSKQYKSEYNNEKYLLFHYEDLHKLEKMIPIIKSNNLTIIIDESHNFADEKTRRTKLLVDVVNKLNPTNVIPMSGTPIKASVRELNIIFKLIVKDYTSVIEKRFMKLYKSPGRLLADILREKYSNYTIKIKKENVKLQPITTVYKKVKLPNGDIYTLENIKKEMKNYYKTKLKDYKDNFVKYEAEYKHLYNIAKNSNTNVTNKEYEKYENYIKKIVSVTKKGGSIMKPEYMEYISYCNKFEKEQIIPYLSPEDKKKFKNVKSIYKYPKLKVIGEVLAYVIMGNRTNCIIDIAGVFNYEEVIETTIKKTIIFSSYVNVCDTAKQRCIELRYEPLTVYGSDSKYLSDTVGKFNAIEKYNPLITTYKSLSTGVPLIVANHIIALDIPFRRYIYEQAIGRAWRTGQDKPVTIYIPELDTGDKPNINDRNLDIMEFYIKAVNQITGDSIPEDMLAKNTVKEDMNISTEEYILDLEYVNENNDKGKHYNIINAW